MILFIETANNYGLNVKYVLKFDGLLYFCQFTLKNKEKWTKKCYISIYIHTSNMLIKYFPNVIETISIISE